MKRLNAVAILLLVTSISQAQLTPAKNVAIWPDLAPGETSGETGTDQINKPNEKRPVIRTYKIRKPTLDIFPADNPNGVGVLILPGGGFGKVVPNLEGSEAAEYLTKLGISTFVLRYRTKKEDSDPGWKRALQDSQRAMAWLRENADEWKLDTDKLGLFGFSAGGQVAARHLTDHGKLAYEKIDATDEVSHAANFAILIYPWRMYDAKTDGLIEGIDVTKEVPPTFIVHTHDDASTSLGAVHFYAGLKKASVDAELHVYRNGGHGYGTRPRKNSNIGTWPDRMVDWLKNKELGR